MLVQHSLHLRVECGVAPAKDEREQVIGGQRLDDWRASGRKEAATQELCPPNKGNALSSAAFRAVMPVSLAGSRRG